MSIINSEKHINIVSFDIPFPPNYGGVIDVYYKIKALKEAGVKIHLFCFQYGRNTSKELEDLCEEVYYYPRKKLGGLFNLRLPYIVKTRRSRKLNSQLCRNGYPVLFEGVHCTYSLSTNKLSGKKTIIRMHNIEYLYYMHLAKVESNPVKRLFFSIEASRLKTYQKTLDKADYIAAISPSDQIILNLKHQKSFYLPVFHPNNKVISKTGRGDYILYHGNLGVGENNEAAIYLVKEVFSKIDIPVIIAGSNPSGELVRAASTFSHISITNPQLDEIYELIQNAQINVLPTFQDTGIKLKLLNALFQGRYCLVNSKMVKETGLEELCIICDNPNAMISQIQSHFIKNFTASEIKKREELLLAQFDNTHNIMKLLERI